MNHWDLPRQTLQIALEDQVLKLTIARPEQRNALNDVACAELGQALDDAEQDASVRVVIITGAGDKAFSAGFDLQYAEAHPEVYQDPLFGSQIVRRAPGSKPLIAAVNGIALGLGFELALACDLIVAVRHARFGLPEPSVGLAAMGGGVARLSRQIGLKRALGLVLTSRVVTADEGFALGFVNEVTHTAVMETAMLWARLIAKGAPLSIAASLQMAYQGADLPLQQALDPRVYPAVMQLLDSEDAQEGRKAFLERRKPVWQGR